MMKSFTKYIAEQFRKPSGIGGILSTWFMNNLNRHQYKAIKEQIKGRTDNEKILDIGFGNGMLIKKLTKISDAQFYGIDIAEDMIPIASKRNKKNIEKKKVTLLQADIENLPFEENTFDVIYTVNTIYFWNDINRGLSEINRVLKPEGVFYNVGYTKQWLNKLRYTQYGFRKYETNEIKESAENSGLEFTNLTELKKGASYCMTIRKKEK